jgi:Flp pilus assembly protein TadD
MKWVKGKWGFALLALAGITLVIYVVSKQRRDTAGKHIDQVRVHNARGIALLEMDRLVEAAQEFHKAVELDPDYAYGHINLGLSYVYMYDEEKALQALHTAEQFAPDNLHLHYLFGLIYMLQGKTAAAIERFERVLGDDPDDPYTMYYLGTLYFGEGRTAEASRKFHQALQVDPAFAAAHHSLGLLFLQAGDEKTGLAELEAARRFQKSPLGSKVGHRYMEQGKYALALEEFSGPRQTLLVAQDTEVRFTDVTLASGVRFLHGGTAKLAFQPGQRVAADLDVVSQRVLPAYGSGAAFIDFDADKDLDLYMVNAAPTQDASANALYRNNGDGSFTDVTREAGVGNAGQGMAVTFGDYDNDGDPDLYMTNHGPNVLYRNNGDGTFIDVSREAGVDHTGFGMGTTFVDYDHDGHLDLFVANYVDVSRMPAAEELCCPEDFSGAANVLYRNNGDGTFGEVTTQARLDGTTKSISAVFFDYDNDNDIDLYLGNDGEPDVLYSNNRDGSFLDVTKEAGLEGVTTSRGVAAGDYNGDSFMDLLVTSGTKPGVTLFRNQGDGSFTRDTSFERLVRKRDPLQAWGAAIIDYNNDGYLDIVVVTGAPTGGVLLYRNRGDGSFMEVTADVGLPQVTGVNGRGLTLGDYDRDGDTDLFIVNNGGAPTLLRNDGGNKHRWLKVVTVGDGSNRMGFGSKVEVKAGRLWQKKEVAAGSGYLSQNSAELLFGLDGKEQIGTVHILWPSGLRQPVLNVTTNQTLTLTEQGRKSSCPLLYTWDGDTYTFITDFLGAGFIGILVGQDTYYQPDTDEYIKVDGSRLREKAGQYTIKITEQLEEVDYLDQVRLLVVDHPPATDIYPNETLKMGPPFPAFKIYLTRDASLPISAVDHEGNDVLPAIQQLDRRYPTFPLLPYQGISTLHSLILDLGDLSRARTILLLMDGWIEYWNSESVRQALEDGITLQGPVLQVLNQQGEWVTVIEDLGFPAGLPKTMTVDLTGKFLSDDYRVKITTNMEIYWDRIRVSTYASPDPLHVTTLKPSHADLRWRGYPKLFLPDGKNPPIFLYDQLTNVPPWGDQAGYYTRYGEVTSLLEEIDDQYVIMRHGEEISIDFSAREVRPLPPGWVRDFLVYVDGYVKDRWPNTAYGATVAPLPFHSMSRYPYPEAETYPDDWQHRAYLQNYNTRWIGGNLP